MTMYMIEISSEEKDELKDKAKKLLKYGKELYECIEDLVEGSQMGERGGYGRYGNRGGYGGGSSSGGYSGGGGYGNRYGNREDEDWDDDDYDFGERRGRSSRTGRYVRR